MKVIPADDYDGDCDRYHLWDTLVYPPSQRLLEGAFPDYDWAAFADVRPKKPKKQKKVHENQLGFALTPRASTRVDDYSELAVPKFSREPLIIRIPEIAARNGGLERVKEVCATNPGARPIEIVLDLASGASATLTSPMRVATGPKFAKLVEAAIAGPEQAAS